MALDIYLYCIDPHSDKYVYLEPEQLAGLPAEILSFVQPALTIDYDREILQRELQLDEKLIFIFVDEDGYLDLQYGGESLFQLPYGHKFHRSPSHIRKALTKALRIRVDYRIPVRELASASLSYTRSNYFKIHPFFDKFETDNFERLPKIIWSDEQLNIWRRYVFTSHALEKLRDLLKRWHQGKAKGERLLIVFSGF